MLMNFMNFSFLIAHLIDLLLLNTRKNIINKFCNLLNLHTAKSVKISQWEATTKEVSSDSKHEMINFEFKKF